MSDNEIVCFDCCKQNTNLCPSSVWDKSYRTKSTPQMTACSSFLARDAGILVNELQKAMDCLSIICSGSDMENDRDNANKAIYAILRVKNDLENRGKK